jgi:hypothetical protein
MPRDAGPNQLLESLVDLDRAQAAWLQDLRGTLPGDAACTEAFARWEESLTLVKLRLHRSEQRLFGSLMNGVPAPIDEVPAEDATTVRNRMRDWRDAFEGWFAVCHLPSTYRHLDTCLDLDQEAVHADIITDLAGLAEVSETTGASLAHLEEAVSLAELEDMAFYRIIAPWRTRGVPALHDALRWLSETLRDHEDW